MAAKSTSAPEPDVSDRPHRPAASADDVPSRMIAHLQQTSADDIPADRCDRRYGTFDLKILNLGLFNADTGTPCRAFEYGESVCLGYLLNTAVPVTSDILLGVQVKSVKGDVILSVNDLHRVPHIACGAGDSLFASMVFPLALSHGRYYLLTGIMGFRDGSCWQGDRYEFSRAIALDVIDRVCFFEVRPYVLAGREFPLAGPVHADGRVEIRPF